MGSIADPTLLMMGPRLVTIGLHSVSGKQSLIGLRTQRPLRAANQEERTNDAPMHVRTFMTGSNEMSNATVQIRHGQGPPTCGISQPTEAPSTPTMVTTTRSRRD